MTVAKKYGQIQELRSNIPLSDKVVGLKEALAGDPVNPQLWYELGLAYAEQQLYLEAEEAMSEAVSYSPFFTDAFAMKGDYHVRIGRYDEGAADLSMATHLTLTNADYWLKFGISLYLGQEYHRAWRAFEFALEHSGSDQAKFWFALALLKNGDFDHSKAIAASASDCTLCKVLSGELDAVEAIRLANDMDDHKRVAITYAAAEYIFACGKCCDKTEYAEDALRALIPCLDTCWYGYFEHAVRVALKMDAAVRCVFL